MLDCFLERPKFRVSVVLHKFAAANVFLNFYGTFWKFNQLIIIKVSIYQQPRSFYRNEYFDFWYLNFKWRRFLRHLHLIAESQIWLTTLFCPKSSWMALVRLSKGPGLVRVRWELIHRSFPAPSWNPLFVYLFISVWWSICMSLSVLSCSLACTWCILYWCPWNKLST